MSSTLPTSLCLQILHSSLLHLGTVQITGHQGFMYFIEQKIILVYYLILLFFSLLATTISASCGPHM